MSKKIDEEFLEEQIVKFSLTDEEFLNETLPYLKTKSISKSYFQDAKNQLIYNVSSSFYERYKKLPTKEEVIYLIRKAEIDDEIKTLSCGMIERYSNIEKASKELILDEARNFIKKARIQEALVLSVEKIENDKYDEIPDTINEAINIGSKKKATSINSNFDEKDFIEMMEAEKNIKKIATEYKGLDETLNGGFKPEKLYAFAGVAGGGKSILLLQFALNALRRGENILFYSMEMSESVIKQRINTNILPDKYYDSSNSVNFLWNTNKEQVLIDLKAEYSRFTGNLDIVYPDDIGTTAKEIEKTLQGKDYSILFVDYLGIMENTKGENPDNPHFKYKAIAEELRALSKKYKIPVITALQLNADGYKKQAIDLSNLAYSTGIGHTLDFVASISPSCDELSILKNRDGITNTLQLEMNKAKYKVNKIIDMKEADKAIGIKNE